MSHISCFSMRNQCTNLTVISSGRYDSLHSCTKILDSDRLMDPFKALLCEASKPLQIMFRTGGSEPLDQSKLFDFSKRCYASKCFSISVSISFLNLWMSTALTWSVWSILTYLMSHMWNPDFLKSPQKIQIIYSSFVIQDEFLSFLFKENRGFFSTCSGISWLDKTILKMNKRILLVIHYLWFSLKSQWFYKMFFSSCIDCFCCIYLLYSSDQPW